MRRRLPIRVESACREDWSAMPADGAGRHCDRCATTVIDLTRATRSQAESLLRASGGKMCARVRANGAGVAVFAPEPVRRGLVPMALAGLLAACATTPPAEQGAPEVTPETTPEPVGLALPTTGSFGGSLATGAMMPIGPAPASPPVVLASIAPSGQQQEAVEPTDEQRALTHRKHRRQHVSYPPPPQHHLLMGGIGMRP